MCSVHSSNNNVRNIKEFKGHSTSQHCLCQPKKASLLSSTPKQEPLGFPSELCACIFYSKLRHPGSATEGWFSVLLNSLITNRLTSWWMCDSTRNLFKSTRLKKITTEAKTKWVLHPVFLVWQLGSAHAKKQKRNFNKPLCFCWTLYQPKNI